MSRLPDEIKKKNHFIFPELKSFEHLGTLKLSARYLKHYLS